MATEIGRLGVWTSLDGLPPAEAAEVAGRIEAWGYGTLWIPEAVAREPFPFIAYLSTQTERLVYATGIASIYARDAMTLRAIHETLSDIAPGRFVLGLGVSHAPMVEGVRGHTYGKPLTAMRNALDGMEKATYLGHQAAEKAPIVLAALRDRMLALAAERTAGAHPYFVPPEHTAIAREVMGPDAWLCPEQKVLLETDPAKARDVARKAMAIYLGLPNYRNNLLRLGYDEADLDGGGSDKLVDAIVAWGDEEAIRRRIAAHHDAGADHVCIQPLRPDGQMGPDLHALEALAPG